MKRKMPLGIFLGLAFIISGCTTPPPPNASSRVQPVVGDLRNQVFAAQTSILKMQQPLDEAEGHIDNAKVAVQSGATNDVVGELDSARAKIEDSKTFLSQANVNLGTAMNTATQAVVRAQQSDKDNQKLQKDNSDLKEKLSSQQQWVYKLLAGVAAFIIVAGIGICVASAMTGFASMQIGIGVSVGGIVLLILTLTIQKYATYLTAACGILLLGLMIYFGWKLFTSFKANKELVQFGEAVKASADDNLKKKLFGDGTSPHPNSIADSIQSDSTQKIVDAAQQQLKIDQVKNS